MRLHYCGVRGSTPAPGFAFAGVGGNTSCVAVQHDAEPAPRLVLDAGTGIRSVSQLLDGEPFVGTVLLSHLHWDHVNGLPFFAAADRADARVQLLLPHQGDGRVPIDILRHTMSPPYFPIGPEGLRGPWCFGAMQQGQHSVEGFQLLAGHVPHKGGPTFGFRVSDGRSSFAYLPDHRPVAKGPSREAALDLCRGVDLVIHDAQFLPAEAAIAHQQGHSTIDEAVGLAVEAGAREVVLFHHGPSRTDVELDKIVTDLAPRGIQVTLAREGCVRSLGGSPGEADDLSTLGVRHSRCSPPR